jgi:hypothetical protein
LWRANAAGNAEVDANAGAGADGAAQNWLKGWAAGPREGVTRGVWVTGMVSDREGREEAADGTRETSRDKVEMVSRVRQVFACDDGMTDDEDGNWLAKMLDGGKMTKRRKQQMLVLAGGRGG